MKKEITQLSLNEVNEFVSTIPPSERYLFVHLMKMSLLEIRQYEAAMREKYGDNIPMEILQEIRANIRNHQQEFGEEGMWRKLILRSKAPNTNQ